MYEINFDRIQKQGDYLRTCVQVIHEVGSPTSKVATFALMRSFHIAVECIIDIGNTIIDGFIMRDPGGYSDIIDILEDEQVIPVNLANKLKEFVKIREQLVRKYDEFDEELLDAYRRDVNYFSLFLEQVNTYLQNEKSKGNIYA